MTTTPQTRCPNCHAAVPPGKLKCICGLEVAKFADYARAKKAAYQKGKRLEVEEAPLPWYRQPLFIKAAIALSLVLILIISIITWKSTRPAPWAAFPTSREAAVNQLLALIHTDSDSSLDAAYALVASENKIDQPDSLRGKYRQLFHNVNGYLSGEFGSDWLKVATVSPDPANTDRFLVRIGPETLHVLTAQESPKPTPPGKPDHYSVRAIEEFDVNDAGAMQQIAGITGVIEGIGGPNAGKNLNSVIGGLGGNRRETTMQTKMRLLPILRNPRDLALKRCTMEAWKVRNDPVIKSRLELITEDARYDQDIRNVAKSVLDDSITEEELAAIGINK